MRYRNVQESSGFTAESVFQNVDKVLWLLMASILSSGDLFGARPGSKNHLFAKLQQLFNKKSDVRT